MTKPISAGLKAHYAAGTTTLATCWKATLTNGTVVAATSHDRDIPFEGTTYQSIAAYNYSTIQSGSELNPDNLELEGFLASPAITDEDILSGIWDYAQVEMFEVNYADLSQGRNMLRYGTLGQVRTGRASFVAELRGLAQAYTRRIVRLITRECNADLGDARCTINLANWTDAASVATVTGNRLITNPGLRTASNWYTGGKLTFTSGANNGLSMEVKNSSGSSLTLMHPMPFDIEVGDTFMVHAGCTKRYVEDCIGKFNNGINFRGFPHLPGTAVFGGPGTQMLNSGRITPPPAPGPVPSPPAPPGPPVSVMPGASGATFSQPAGSISIVDHGAVPGMVNNISAINAAIAAAQATAEKIVWVPDDLFGWSGQVIHLNGVQIVGAGYTQSTLYALDYTHAAIWLEGSGAAVKQLKLAGADAPGRQADWEMCKVVAMGATNWTITNCWIEGSPAASIQTANGASNGTISFNSIYDSLSDSIHMTDGASSITVESNYIERSGDDGIAVVSYQSDGTPCSNITARNNVVKNQLWGRNMSVVGGNDVLYYNNYLEGNPQFAGIYVAQEEFFATMGVNRFKGERNTVKNCGSLDTGHAGIMVFSDGEFVNDDIWLLRNDIDQTGNAGVHGIRYFGPQTNVKLDQNRYTGTGQAVVAGGGTTVTVNTPYTSGAVGYTQPTAPAPAPAPAPGSPAPAPVGSYPSIVTGSYESTFLQMGNDDHAYWIHDNRWGQRFLVEGRDFMQEVGRVSRNQIGPNGEVAARIRWSWPAMDWEVKAYPSILYGAKPGYAGVSGAPWKPGGMEVLLYDGTVSTASPSGWTPGTMLPMQCPVGSLKAFSQHAFVQSPTGRGHLAWDIWLQSHPDQTSGFPSSPITHEIMIPLEHWGGYGSYDTDTDHSAIVDTVNIGGRTYHVLKRTNFMAGALDGSWGRTGWTFIVFKQADADLPINGEELDLAAFINYVAANHGLTAQHYLVSAELGVEPHHGTGDLVVHNFRIYP